MTFRLAGIPGDLAWRNTPAAWQVEEGERLAVTAGGETDLFTDPAGNQLQDNAPCALFTPPDGNFILSALVKPDFASTFDAGVLQIRGRDDLWAKLCFEFSPQRQPMVVSVVTRGVSDDCNSAPIDGGEVRLRIARNAGTFAFHYSHDGRFWHLVRYFSLGQPDRLQAGFSAQSPTGRECRVVFSEIRYAAGGRQDIRGGE